MGLSINPQLRPQNTKMSQQVINQIKGTSSQKTQVTIQKTQATSQTTQATSQKTQATSDENACNIKVETCPKVTKFFSAFKECYAMAQEVEEMNKAKLEDLMTRLCILRKQNDRLREKNCKLREQYKRLLCEYNKVATSSQ